MHLLGILVGCESGVECHDALTTAFGGFPSNGIEKSLTRRDKHPMGEAVRAAGLRAVKQKLCGSWADARAFCGDELKVQTGETGAWCVLKPCKSAGTDGVFIAKSLAEAEPPTNPEGAAPIIGLIQYQNQARNGRQQHEH